MISLKVRKHRIYTDYRRFVLDAGSVENKLKDRLKTCRYIFMPNI